MAYKKNLPGWEYSASLDKEISPKLKKAIESYLCRNHISTHKGKKICCPSCLKAFLVSNPNKECKDLIKSWNLSYESIGHEGYYLDGEELKELKL
jgi:hypothetical protein